jgi:hypothetical protein
MTRFLPRPLALLALLAFGLSMTEGLWASTCDMRMPGGNAPPAAMAGMDMGQHAPAGSRSGNERRPQSTDCPLAAALAYSGGCVITSHPTAALPALAMVPEQRLVPHTAAPGLPHLLLSARPFHPPRA